MDPSFLDILSSENLSFKEGPSKEFDFWDAFGVPHNCPKILVTKRGAGLEKFVPIFESEMASAGVPDEAVTGIFA